MPSDDIQKLLAELEAKAGEWEGHGNTADKACARQLRAVMEDYE